MSAPLEGESLDEFLDRSTEAEIPFVHSSLEGRKVAERFRLGSLAQADWAMRRLRAAVVRLGEIDAEANAWRAKIDEWHAAQSRKPGADLDYFTGLLREYLRTVREIEEVDGVPEAKRTKTLKLPSGDVARTAGRQSIVVDDEAALLAYIAENVEDPAVLEQLVSRPAPTVKRGEIPKVFAVVEKDDARVIVDPTSGTIVPGVHAEIGEATITPRPKP